MQFVQGVYDFFLSLETIRKEKGVFRTSIPRSANIVSCRYNALSNYLTMSFVADPHLVMAGDQIPGDTDRTFLLMSSNQEHVATKPSEALYRHVCSIEALHVFEITEA